MSATRTAPSSATSASAPIRCGSTARSASRRCSRWRTARWRRAGADRAIAISGRRRARWGHAEASGRRRLVRHGFPERGEVPEPVAVHRRLPVTGMPWTQVRRHSRCDLLLEAWLLAEFDAFPAERLYTYTVRCGIIAPRSSTNPFEVTPAWKTTARRPCPPPSARSKSSSARARSCGWAMPAPPTTSRPVSTGSLGLDIALGIGGLPTGRVVEIYGPESSGKTTLTLQVVAEVQKAGGTAAFVDAEHALDPTYAAEARRQHRRPAGLAARHRRAGPRNHRHAGALRRGRCRRHRLGRRADAEGRNRRRDGRYADGLARPPDVAGAAQAHRQHQALEHHGHLHQPDPHEDRRDVRQSRNHHRWQRAQVLRLGAPRYPPHRRDQERRGSRRQPDARQGREEQGRAAVPRGRVRNHVRRRHLPRRRDHRPRQQATASSRSPAPGTATRASASARARTTRATS